ncbi:transcriptional regulator of RNA polII, SAGA, subunit-domain-containing protein [Cytidiella melzeri]|nr:transcriptional regulator of RNA polII, SAGA, subunit-domain-containing protein [Cytidiella melzeri]
MSLSSPTTIKAQLATALGPKTPLYYKIFQEYLSGRLSRVEFDEQIKDCLGADNITSIQLHNALIVSLLDPSAHLAPPTPPPDAPPPPPRKRRRTLPYQGEDDDTYALRSSRLKRWAVGLGKRERERLRGLETVALGSERRPRRERDEIAMERGVVLLQERGEPPGSRLPLHLASVTRAPTLQHISDRINLISAQHNLAAPNRNVAQLLMLAFEYKVKQLIIGALSMSSTSHAITSIKPSSRHSFTSHLSANSFTTLFTISPAMLPYKSATAMRLALGENDTVEEGPHVSQKKEVNDQRVQMFALLGERSTIKEALNSRTIP